MAETIHEIIQRISNYYKKKGKPEVEHVIGYDSAAEGLEPIYFFITDLMNDFGLKTEKIIDNFTSSPGSGHFGELGQRATIMQQQGAKILADINAVLRSVLNLIYDLKDFKMRLSQYGGLKSKDKLIRDAAILSLKQIWMDKVDIQKGNSSIKSMALGQAGFITLIDAFLSVADEKEVDKIDLNERVKRILKPRIQEFNIWLIQSENELKKRYELEKNYLRSQVNSLKLYSRWAKPYLKAAQQLEQKESGRNVDLVKTFNTILLELTLFGKSKLDIKSTALAGDLPQEFSKDSFLKKQRNYNVCILVDFYFRGIPQRVSQQQAHYTFGGKTKVTFSAYVLNDDELEKLNQELSKSDLEDVFGLIEGATTDSLGRLQEEIDSFLNEKDEGAEKEKKKSNEVNPFLALIGVYEKKEKTEKSSQKENQTKEKKEK
ncbi:MAG: hypothetical protein AABY06_00255, partial [Nanoarchaeota archaeon]